MIKNINARTGRICVGNAQNPESASLDGTNLYAYAYDAVGNRVSVTETTNSWAYTANALNQYTSIVGNNDGMFIPEYDDDGNQTLVKTETGVWRVAYNGENRPVAWSNGTTVVEMSYDDTGRRRAKRVVSPGSEVLHTFLYDGYLLIAENAVSNGVPLTPVNYVWDPAEPVATRALCTLSGTNLWFHTHDLTKNVWELLDRAGNIVAPYGYAPFGAPSIDSGATDNRIGWSSEYADPDSGYASYLFRDYWGLYGRWLSRDPVDGAHLYGYVNNRPLDRTDFRGESDCTLTLHRGEKPEGQQIPPGAGGFFWANSPFLIITKANCRANGSGWDYTVSPCKADIWLKGYDQYSYDHETSHFDCLQRTNKEKNNLAQTHSGCQCSSSCSEAKTGFLLEQFKFIDLEFNICVKERDCKDYNDCFLLQVLQSNRLLYLNKVAEKYQTMQAECEGENEEKL